MGGNFGGLHQILALLLLFDGNWWMELRFSPRAGVWNSDP